MRRCGGVLRSGWEPCATKAVFSALKDRSPLAYRTTFLYRTRPLKLLEITTMMESSLSKLEQLVSDLVQQKQELLDANTSLNAELAQAKDENESLQLSLMEQEEKQGATAARIQALVERVSPVNA